MTSRSPAQLQSPTHRSTVLRLVGCRSYCGYRIVDQRLQPRWLHMDGSWAATWRSELASRGVDDQNLASLPAALSVIQKFKPSLQAPKGPELAPVGNVP